MLQACAQCHPSEESIQLILDLSQSNIVDRGLDPLVLELAHECHLSEESIQLILAIANHLRLEALHRHHLRASCPVSNPSQHVCMCVAGVKGSLA